MAQAGPIAVYGSTGYTGRLVVQELHRRGLEMVLSGRDESKLARLAGGLGNGVDVIPATVDDPASLRRLLDGSSAVINCAGPFSKIGERVVAAAIASGTHYVDTTGEQLYIKKIFTAYGDRARQANVAVVPAVGFDFVPGDLIANLTAQGMGALDELTIAYYVTGMRPTHGTMLSVIEIMKDGRVTYEHGDWRIVPGRATAQQFDFPAPIGVQTVFDYPSAEILTVPRHVSTQAVTSLLSASAFGPAAIAPAFPAIMFGASLLARTPAVGLMRSAVRKLPEGPTDEQRQQVRFTVVARARAGSQTNEGTVSGADVYGITAVIAAEAAARMAEPGYECSGVLAPAEALDAGSFLDALGQHGVTYQVARSAVAVNV